MYLHAPQGMQYQDSSLTRKEICIANESVRYALGGGGGGGGGGAKHGPACSKMVSPPCTTNSRVHTARKCKDVENGPAKAARHFLQILDCKVQKSTMRHNVSRFKARDSSDSNGETPNSDCSRRNCRALFTRQTFGVMASSLGMLHMLGVAVCWCWSHLCS